MLEDERTSSGVSEDRRHEASSGGGERPSPPPETTELRDEPPGAYLREFRAGRWSAGWATANLLITLAVGAARLAGLAPASPWWVPARLAWSLLPASCIVLLLLALWLVLVGAGERSPRGLLLTLGVDLAALVTRLALGAGTVSFEIPET